MATPVAQQQAARIQTANIHAAQQKFASVLQHVHQLRNAGATPETNPDFERCLKFLQSFAAAQPSALRLLQADPVISNYFHSANGHTTPSTLNGGTYTNGLHQPSTPSASGQQQPYPTSPSTPVSFTPDQINALRSQIHAFKLLSRGMAVPEHLQQAIHLPTQAIQNLEATIQGTEPEGRTVDSVVKLFKASSGTPEASHGAQNEEGDVDVKTSEVSRGPFAKDVVESGIYPYNAYVHPFSYLQRATNTDPALFASRLQRLLVPTIMPRGLDPHLVINERNRFIDARIQQRIRELEAMPATSGDGGLDPYEDGSASDGKENAMRHLDTGAMLKDGIQGKLKAAIELKSLRVLDRQRELRAMVAERLTHGSLLPFNRAEFKRKHKPTVKDARDTEQLERKQRVERERRAKQKHVEQLDIICKHGREVISVNRAAQDRVIKLGRSVLSFHVHTEKEEQKRIERISKERLKALKADDEEAYMKLIDTAKDTRITHLLRQTDQYLDSLAQAVMAQQNDGVHSNEEPLIFETEDGPTNEATFGAKVSADDEVVDKKKIDYYAVAHRIKEKVSKQPNLLVGGTLKDYQVKGLQWMVSLYNNRLNGILADEMGLGKTIQTIALITFLIETKRQRGPYLVIVPLSTMTNWSGEFARWAPGVRMISYKGNPNQRKALQNDIRMGQFQVLLTTYEYIIKDRPVLSKLKWVHMIIDEGHRMKNTQSKLTHTLTTYYHSRYRLILTGTPLQNNLPELWALLNFVLPKIFNSVQSFDEWFNTPFANSGTPDKIELNEEEALLIIRRLHKVLRPFLLRRLKKDVESELPDKVEKVVKVKMSALQAQLYKQMKKYKMIADGKDANGKSGGVKGLSNELMQLRKICQHPFLFESVEDKMNPSGMVDDKLIRSAGKIELLHRILPKFFATNHRVLIFFQMTKVMDIMEDFMKMMGWKYLRLDGGTKTEDRAGHVQMFNAPSSEYKVFILSTRAGGLGLNLQTADTVIIFDSDWNPHADLQAQDRAHRIGQTKVVRILRFITEKSVEEAMYARARYKLDIDDKVIQAGRFDNKSTQEEREEFLRSILEADQEEENEESGDMNDDEINELISRSEEESQTFRDMDIKREREAAEAWKLAGNRGKPPLPLIQLEELPECYQTDEPFESKDIDEELEGRGQRRRNAVNYSDGLSDEQWAMAIEEGEDVEELAERARERRRGGGPMMDDIESASIMESSAKNRKSKKGKTKTIENVFDSAPGKRKRGTKAMSVTPSVQDEDEDDRNMKRRKTDVPAPVREKMKKAFGECLKAVMNCEDDTGRKRCELFKELPDKRDYPDYYQLIPQPIALSHLRKRANSGYYKDVNGFRDDFKLMFRNARTYNQEGSWVYIDAEEMEKVFDAAYDRFVTRSSIAVTPGGSGTITPVGTEERSSSKARLSGRRLMDSDDEFLTPSDDE